MANDSVFQKLIWIVAKDSACICLRILINPISIWRFSTNIINCSYCSWSKDLKISKIRIPKGILVCLLQCVQFRMWQIGSAIFVPLINSVWLAFIQYSLKEFNLLAKQAVKNFKSWLSKAIEPKDSTKFFLIFIWFKRQDYSRLCPWFEIKLFLTIELKRVANFKN